MGAYKYISELWKRKQCDIMRFLRRIRCWELRHLPRVHRAPRPTRPDRAKRLGYRKKQGYVIYRTKVRRGDRKKNVHKGRQCRKPKYQGVHKHKSSMNLRRVAEGRVGHRCKNLRVLNSYWIGQDSTYKYFEVILVDPFHPAIRNDPKSRWICNPVHKHRELHGLTGAGKAYRGLYGKGHCFKKQRPSRHASWRRRNTLSLRRYR
ncbi:hypothetical protein Pelo_7377B [Pelomyxa schiedti]|nr:hypothetical protein Pelo_7377B [Pelomyxa schiedti]